MLHHRPAAVVFAAALLLISPALAGPVTYQGGSINVSYRDISGGDDDASFPVTAPGSATESYDGTALIDDGTGLGDNRGNSGASYEIADLPDGATFDATVFHSNNGDDERTLGGSVDFAANFTTDRPLHYFWHIEPTGASELTASLDQLVESLTIDVFGNASGSLITDGQATPKTLQGTLPAGAHALGLSLLMVNGRSTTGVPDTRASVSLTLSEVDGPAVIPLPPAVWGGLLTMFAAALPAGIRRLRA